jgi:mannosyltransferase OCH1-like enzyme
VQVWQYWEGPMPAYVGLCVQTMRRHHPSMRLLDRALFDQLWTHDRDLRIDHLGPHYRSAFIRVYLLRHYGGLWLDSDYVALRPFDELARLPPEITFAGYRVDGEHFANGLMYSRPGDPVIAGLYERIGEILRDGGPIHWGQLGWEALAPCVAAHREQVHAIDHHDVSPIAWYEAARFESASDATWLFEPRRFGVMLANSSASDRLKDASCTAVLDGDSLLSELLRRALSPLPSRDPA